MDTFLGLLVQSCCGEGGTLPTDNTGVCSQWLSHTGFAPAPAHCVCAFPVYTAQAVGCSAGNCLRSALGCVHFPGLSRLGSGTRVVLRGTDSVGPLFCALPRSEQLRWPGVWWARSLRLIASPVLAAWFSGCTTSAPSQVDVDHPESQEVLAMKPACSLVDIASLGPRSPPSCSGCLSPEGDGLQPAISAQSFVLWVGLTVS